MILVQSGVTAYDLLLSYPSDLASCTPLIKSTITEFNNHFGRNHSIVVRPVHWRDDAYPVLGDSAQGLINKQIADNCDLVFACFWTRFGSPTDGYASGTEEEVERARGAKRQVFLYFLEKPMDPYKMDPEQFASVRKYRDKVGKEGLYFSADDERSLVADFRQKLEQFFTAKLANATVVGSGTSKRVLWVDDCPQNNVYERTLMEDYGAEFSLALSTNEALRLIKHQTYNLIISDMGRKEGPREGYVLLDTLRRDGNNTPLLFFASFGSAPQHVAEAIKHGGQGCTDDGAELIEMAFKILLRGDAL